MRDNAVLKSAVESGKFIPSAGKILGEKFTVYIMEKNNSRGKRQASVTEFKNGIFPAR
jgi:hypothetical protein